MSYTSHTPGPWSVTKPDRHGYAHVNASNWMGLAEVCVEITDEPSGEPLPYYCERGNANAHLIAAAPDLLAACEVVEWFGQHWDGTRGYCPCCGRCEDSGHDGDCALGNAIAKARPKPPPA